jgi:hypothetical protein
VVERRRNFGIVFNCSWQITMILRRASQNCTTHLDELLLNCHALCGPSCSLAGTVRQKPLSTSILLDDIIQRHFAFLTPRHVLFLIDSCSSGLALPRTADAADTASESILRYQQLALLDSELKWHAYNLLVASAGDAKALYQNGGLFTKVLAQAIESRSADLNNDGLIQFDELNFHVSNPVKIRSKESGLEQSPSPYRVGTNFVFILPPPGRKPN